MATEKPNQVHSESLANPAYVRTDEIEEETDTVLLDVGAAKLEGGGYGNLKLARDGHVC